MGLLGLDLWLHRAGATLEVVLALGIPAMVFPTLMAAALAHPVFAPHRIPWTLVFGIASQELINDTHGHGCSDEVIRRVAGVLRDETREGDLVRRLGGEGFGVLLPGTDLPTARALAERLRAHAEQLNPVCPHGSLRVTVSLGLPGVRGRCDLDSLVHQSDENLYTAKHQVRNQVVEG